jgi:hypothetical protein
MSPRLLARHLASPPAPFLDQIADLEAVKMQLPAHAHQGLDRGPDIWLVRTSGDKHRDGDPMSSDGNALPTSDLVQELREVCLGFKGTDTPHGYQPLLD